VSRDQLPLVTVTPSWQVGHAAEPLTERQKAKLIRTLLCDEVSCCHYFVADDANTTSASTAGSDNVPNSGQSTSNSDGGLSPGYIGTFFKHMQVVESNL
jgi:hypothetical protein